MRCPTCGVEMTPREHNNRGYRCPSCWSSVPEPTPTGEPPTETSTSTWVAPPITDAARELAEEHGIDWVLVEGTGTGGRILVRDVKGAM